MHLLKHIYKLISSFVSSRLVTFLSLEDQKPEKKKLSGLKRLQFPSRSRSGSFDKLCAHKGLLRSRTETVRSPDGSLEETWRTRISDLVIDDSDDERAARTCGHLLAALKVILEENTHARTGCAREHTHTSSSSSALC